MHKTDFFKLFHDRYELSYKITELLRGEFEECFYKKGASIIEQDCHIYDIIFLSKGIVVTRFFRDGKEIVTNISFEGDIVAFPFKKSSISPATLLVIEDCIIFKIKFSRFEELIHTHHELSIFSYHLFKHLICLLAEEYFEFAGLEAKEAYEKAVKSRPELINRVPLKYLAANLRVTPSSLSRIRASNKDKNK
ncbi:MAG: Crp/Fnr family transcriptional regulator [Tannerellaceae bacterium]